MDLKTSFVGVAVEMGISDTEALQLFNLLPQRIQRALVTPHPRNGRPQYYFGKPIDRLPKGKNMVGSQMFTLVERLVVATVVMAKRLDGWQIEKVQRRLEVEEKHQDVLSEFFPLLFMAEAIPAFYEVPGEGGKTIEWLIKPSRRTPILLEVKNRLKDLIEWTASYIEGGSSVVNPPNHDPQLLFASTVEKFKEEYFERQLQGVWIITQLKQDRIRLCQVFNALNPRRLHFAVLANWGPDVHVITREGIDRDLITATLGVKHSEEKVFDMPLKGGRD